MRAPVLQNMCSRAGENIFFNIEYAQHGSTTAGQPREINIKNNDRIIILIVTLLSILLASVIVVAIVGRSDAGGSRAGGIIVMHSWVLWVPQTPPPGTEPRTPRFKAPGRNYCAQNGFRCDLPPTSPPRVERSGGHRGAPPVSVPPLLSSLRAWVVGCGLWGGGGRRKQHCGILWFNN